MKRKYELVRFEEEEGDVLIDEGEVTFEEWKKLYFIIREYFHQNITDEIRVQTWKEKES